MAIFANLVGRLSLESGAFERGARRANQSMRSMQRQSLALHKAVLKVGAVYYGAKGLVRIFQAVTREAVDFEYGMAKVNTMLTAQSEHYLPRLTAQIRTLARAYGESTESLSQGTYDILSAGINAEKAMTVLEASVKAARGGFTDASVTTKAMVGLLNAYQLEASQATRVTDFLHAVVKRGVISFEELAQNIGTVSSLAAVLDVDMEAMGASIATMTRAGINAEIAMTALRSILNTFKNPTEEARQAAAELGFELTANSIRGAGLIEVMQKLRDANAEQLEELMPSVRGLVGFAAQIKNASALADDYAFIMDSAGRSQEAFNKVAETSRQRLDELKQRWSDLKVTLGTPMADVAVTLLEKLAQELANAAEGMRVLSAATSDAQSSMDTFLQSWSEMGFGGIPGATGAATRAGPRFNLPGQRHPTEFGIGVPPAKDPTSQWEKDFDLALDKMREEARFYNAIDAMLEQAKAPEFRRHGMPFGTHPVGTDGAAEGEMDVTAAFRRMYDDIDRRHAESWNVRRDLLDAELARYKEIRGLNQEIVDLWYREQSEQLARAEQIATGGFGGGFRAGIAQMREELATLGEIGAEVAKSMRDGLVGALSDAVFEARDLGDALKNVALDMAKIAYQQIMTNLVTGGMAAIFHGGGTVGGGMQAVRPGGVPPMAPRFHGGGEVGAWLQPGERVQSRGQVAASDKLMGQMVGLLERIASREPGGVTVINAIDPVDILEQAAGTPRGEQVILNVQARNE